MAKSAMLKSGDSGRVSCCLLSRIWGPDTLIDADSIPLLFSIPSTDAQLVCNLSDLQRPSEMQIAADQIVASWIAGQSPAERLLCAQATHSHVL